MMATLALPRVLERAEEDAAAAAMRHAGARLHAAHDDVDLMLAALFAEMQS
jgi:hypothetical protein